jgi:hypothetical protein
MNMGSGRVIEEGIRWFAAVALHWDARISGLFLRASSMRSFSANSPPTAGVFSRNENIEIRAERKKAVLVDPALLTLLFSPFPPIFILPGNRLSYTPSLSDHPF